MTTALKGCKIALSGRFTGRKQSDIKSTIKDNGGSCTGTINDKTTHVVSNDANSTHVKEARNLPHIHIVGIEWLLDSVEHGTMADETSYALPLPALEEVPNDNKHAVDDASDSNEPAHKKQKLAVQTPPAAASGATQNAFDKLEKSLGTEEYKETQKAESAGVHVPVDEGVGLASSYQVYIDKDSTVYDAKLNQTNAGKNNNKFYRIQVLKSTSSYFTTWTRWGRVGERGQNKQLGNGDVQSAVMEFQKKFKEKTGYNWTDRSGAERQPKSGKYTFLPGIYDADSSDDEALADTSKKGMKSANKNSIKSSLPTAVQDLMKLIFDEKLFQVAMAEMKYDAEKLPLGKLSKSTIQQAYLALKALSELFGNHSLAASTYGMSYSEAVLELSNRYLTLIPHIFGRGAGVPTINDLKKLNKEVELLDALRDMRVAKDITQEDVNGEETHPIDRKFASLGMAEMTPLAADSKEFQELHAYLNNTSGQTHYISYEIEDIFRVERHGEFDRFEKSFGKMNADRRLLWHGSRCTNFAGILSQGLRIAPPEAPVSGYMFDKGIYLADMSSKSANYCNSHLSNDIGLLLLCEAELGKPMLELTDATYDAATIAQENNNIAVWGKGTTGPPKWKDAACVHKSLKGVTMPDTESSKPGETKVPGAYLQYNEYIVYDLAQVRLRYLFRVKMSHSY